MISAIVDLTYSADLTYEDAEKMRTDKCNHELVFSVNRYMFFGLKAAGDQDDVVIMPRSRA